MIETLRRVPWLGALPDGALDEVFAAGREVKFKPGQALVGELETGDEMFIVLEGDADVSVAAGLQAPLVVGALHAGDSCGELSLVTHELRSATVVAKTAVVALRLDRTALDTLLSRHPQIAVHFARTVAARIRDTDHALDGMLQGHRRDKADVKPLTGQAAAVAPVRGSFARAWRELVASRLRELPFVALLSFVATLIGVRALLAALGALGVELFPFLRAAYLSGFVLVMLSTATGLMRFRPSTRRWIAVGLGVGLALIANEYSVFLAFDVFYIDMTTRDTMMVFDVDQLYRRSESQWAIALVVLFLLQATYLSRFYRRVWFIIGARIGRLFSR